MNRREFLNGLGAAVATLLSQGKISQTDTGPDAEYWKQEADRLWNDNARLLEIIMQRTAVAESWHCHFQMAQEHAAEYLRRYEEQEAIAADLAVEVAYWREQWEQAQSLVERYREARKAWEEDWYFAALRADRLAEQADAWYDEAQYWRERYEQCDVQCEPVPRTIWVGNDLITDGHYSYSTIAEALGDA